MVPDSIVLTFDVRLPPTTDLVEWEQMFMVSKMVTVMKMMKKRLKHTRLVVMIMITGYSDTSGLAEGSRQRNHSVLAPKDDRSEHDPGL